MLGTTGLINIVFIWIVFDTELCLTSTLVMVFTAEFHRCTEKFMFVSMQFLRCPLHPLSAAKYVHSAGIFV